MPLINEINGNLLKRLAAASSAGSSSTGSSSVDGRGVSTSFEGDSVNISGGLGVAATAFSNSYVRLSGAVSRIDLTRDSLSSLTDIASQLYALAAQSADTETTTEERGKLTSSFQSLINKFRDVLSEASKLTKDVYDNNIDVLDAGDIQSVLGDAGISLSTSTVLAEAFSLIGGSDGEVGYERVVLDDGTEVDPLSQTIDTQANAVNAKDALGKLKEIISDDVSSVGKVLDELSAAQKFAYQSAIASDELSKRVLDNADANRIAQNLVSKIRQQVSDTSIAPHSSLDTALAKELLSDA